MRVENARAGEEKVQKWQNNTTVNHLSRMVKKNAKEDKEEFIRGGK